MRRDSKRDESRNEGKESKFDNLFRKYTRWIFLLLFCIMDNVCMFLCRVLFAKKREKEKTSSNTELFTTFVLCAESFFVFSLLFQ